MKKMEKYGTETIYFYYHDTDSINSMIKIAICMTAMTMNGMTMNGMTTESALLAGTRNILTASIYIYILYIYTYTSNQPGLVI